MNIQNFRIICRGCLFVAILGLSQCTQQDNQVKSVTPSGAESPGEKPAYYIFPEYEKVGAVIVSGFVVEKEETYDLVQQVASTGVKIWYLTSNPVTSQQKLSQAGIGAFEQFKFIDKWVSSFWARDWAPIFALPRAETPNPIFHLIDAFYVNEQTSAEDEDKVPAYFAALSPAYTIAQLPLQNEGGNLMCSKSVCLMSDDILYKNDVTATLDER